MFEELVEFTKSDNIAEDLEVEDLKTIGSDAIEGYKKDLQSRIKWDKNNARNMKLAAQVIEDKNYPWPDASNIKYPLLTEACIQFNSRMYPELVKGDDVVASKVIGEDTNGEKQKKATRVSQHMSWQLLEQQTEWEEDMDKLLITAPIIGNMFKKQYYDPLKGRNRAELVYPKDFVVDYYTKRLEDSTRYSHRIEYNKNKVKRMQLTGLFLDEDLKDPTQPTDQSAQEYDDPNAPEPVYDKDSTPFIFIEQYAWLDLDDDGFDEPYIITVNLESEKVFRIVTCYEPEDITRDVDGNVLGVEQTQYFTKYGFIPSFDGGFYDVGFGQIIGPINHAIDTNINQLIDAGHFSTLQAGFLGRGFRANKGDWRFKPGEWKQTDSMGDDLKRSILPLPTREPSGVLFSLLGLMIQSGQRLASTIDSMVGENPGQNQKATTTMAVLEQGSKIFSGIYKRYHRSLKQELKKQFRLNSIFLETEEYFTVLDAAPAAPQELIRKTDYDLKSFDIVPTADKSYSSQQLKMAKAQGLMELLPTGQVDPKAAVRNMLDAQEQPNIETLMEVPEPGPSIEQLKLELDKAKFGFDSTMRKLEFDLKVLQQEQSEVTTNTNAILALAKAEAEEEGTQMTLYMDQLNIYRDMSKDITDRMKLKQQEMAAAQQGQNQGGSPR